MINTITDRLNKLSWLDDKVGIDTISEVKIQNFLFFYEMFCKAKGKSANFTGLKVCTRGLVFDDVCRDMQYDTNFNTIKNADNINKTD